MSNFETALVAAAKTFLSYYSQPAQALRPSLASQAQSTQASFQDQQIPAGAPIEGCATETSFGVPVCPRHGRAMRASKYGYYCTAKEDDPNFQNKNGFCNTKAKQ